MCLQRSRSITQVFRVCSLLQLGRSVPERPPVTNISVDDRLYLDDIINQVRQWLREDTNNMLELPPANRYQRLLLYQELKKDQFGISDEEKPGFYIQRVRLMVAI